MLQSSSVSDCGIRDWRGDSVCQDRESFLSISWILICLCCVRQMLLPYILNYFEIVFIGVEPLIEIFFLLSFLVRSVTPGEARPLWRNEGPCPLLLAVPLTNPTSACQPQSSVPISPFLFLCCSQQWANQSWMFSAHAYTCSITLMYTFLLNHKNCYFFIDNCISILSSSQIRLSVIFSGKIRSPNCPVCVW